MAMARAKGSDPTASDPKAIDPGSGSAAGGTPEMGYEEARAALADVVAALESGDATLEEALALWERGEEYARVCEAWLAGAQARLSQEERLSQQEERLSQQEPVNQEDQAPESE